jgi:EAL domain-containing protein (putative c-di-GMP-specific phosphodiesterase class I)
MYLSESSGKNKVTVYAAGIDKIALDRVALAADLRHALNFGQLEVYYQALMQNSGHDLYGAEALVRWLHPTRGFVPPREFIPLAEETGQISAIGAWVLRTATMQCAAWRRASARLEDFHISVNLAPIQLMDPNLLELVTNALQIAALPPSGLTLEVTESTLLLDLDHARRQLEAVRRLGVSIAIDDFGTGYSSLSYLAKLPADLVKIDQSFVANLTMGSGPVALVRGIIDMARALNLDVLAEGIESQAQQDILNRLGCAKFQGYMHSKPLPADDFQHQFVRPGSTLAANARAGPRR